MILKQGATYRFTQNGTVRTVIVEELVVFMADGRLQATAKYREPAFNMSTTESAESFIKLNPEIIYY